MLEQCEFVLALIPAGHNAGWQENRRNISWECAAATERTCQDHGSPFTSPNFWSKISQPQKTSSGRMCWIGLDGQRPRSSRHHIGIIGKGSKRIQSTTEAANLKKNKEKERWHEEAESWREMDGTGN